MLAVMLKLLALLGAGELSPSKMAGPKLARLTSVRDVDTSWFAPAKGQVNSLKTALLSKAVHGFMYNSSNTLGDGFEVLNWCNMPHVRPLEYVRADQEFELQYVELVRPRSFQSAIWRTAPGLRLI